MKIEKIKLYDLEIVEIDGEFRKVKKNEQVLPGLLTNHSLYVGKRDGLLETSLTDELYNIVEVFGMQEPENMTNEELEEYGEQMLGRLKNKVDELKVLKIIYLSLVGANPSLDLGFEDFTLKYHEDYEGKMETYVNLISNLVSGDNQFKKEFENKTSTKREKGEKK